jgi:hypothetical protein
MAGEHSYAFASCNGNASDDDVRPARCCNAWAGYAEHIRATSARASRQLYRGARAGWMKSGRRRAPLRKIDRANVTFSGSVCEDPRASVAYRVWSFIMVILIAFGVIAGGVCLAFSYLDPLVAVLCVALYLYGLGRCASVPCRRKGSHEASLSGHPDIDLLISAAWPVMWPCLLLCRTCRHAATIFSPPEDDGDSADHWEPPPHERTPSQ